MRPIDSLDQLPSDHLLRWAAQGMRADVEAWALGAAVAVGCRDLARRVRLAVTGPVDDVVALVDAVRSAMPAVPWRPVGDDAAIAAVCDRLPGLRPRPGFGWMETVDAPAADPRVEPAGEADKPLIDALLDVALPDSLARPRDRYVRRWWVVRDGPALLACACDAWSVPGVGMLAGVATAPQARGRGLGRAVVTTGLAALIRDYGRATLMVDDDNVPGLALYRSLGMSYRTLRAAVPDK